jgi:quercetin 2,3-dioxygenase
VLATGCGSDERQGTGSSADYKIPDTTVVLDQASLAALESVSDDRTSFRFSRSTPLLDRLRTHDVVVAGIFEPLLPFGTLRRVQTIDRSGGAVVLTTVPAALAEAIERAHIRQKIPLREDNVQAVTADGVVQEALGPDGLYFGLNDVVLYDGDGQPGAHDQVMLNGNIGIVPDLELEIDLDGFSLEEATVAIVGEISGNLNIGSGGVIGPGDMQWMTAASGILHKEYHEQNYARRGGPFQMAQLWVNLPKAHKMAQPRYQSITAGRMGLVTLPDGAGSVRVLAGEYRGVTGPAQTFTPINVFDVRLNMAGSADFTIPAAHNAGLLVVKGTVTINGAKATQENFVVFENSGESVHIEADTEAQLLLLSGEPIDEPIVQYGPFVMNSEREILQAFADYNAGKFGHLDD